MVNERLEICKQCDKLNKLNMCEVCYCFMHIKTKLKKARCPIGKW
jgi:hypothetical protein